jgi:predicted site-specific integrase-resolvase
MNLGAWVERNGVVRVTAYRWFRAGLLPVPGQRVGRVILVDEPTGRAEVCAHTAVCARVCSVDQKAGLDRRVAGVTAWATTQQIPVDEVGRYQGWVRAQRAPWQVRCAPA